MISNIASSLGFGSGIDVAKLVSDLAAASRVPKIARLDTRAATVQASISAVARLKSGIDAFASSLAALVADGSLQAQPTVSDASILTAKAISGTRLGPISSQVEVLALARGQTLTADPVAAATDPVGEGTLRLTIGGATHAIAMTAANDSLTGLASAINATTGGVRASIVGDGGGARLIVRGPTGAANAFTLERIDGAASLDRFTTAQMTVAQAASDASVRVDGVLLSRSGNTVDDIIPGVSLTLRAARPGTEVALGGERPGVALKTALSDFATAYNDVRASLAETDTAMRGDVNLRALARSLAAVVSQPVTSGAGVNSLSGIGVATNRDGTIRFDAAKFDAAYTADPDAVEAIFGSKPGIAGAMSALSSAYAAADGRLAGLATRLTSEAQIVVKDRERVEAREAAYKARLEIQFGGVDARIGALKATQSYLDQQIKLWTASQ